eukprot:scaffold36680_cov51-Cyclotella_meneghiniana.AAC.3
MDEWGEYTVQKCDVFDIRQEQGEVMEAIESNNSTVTAIQVKSWENLVCDFDESETSFNEWNSAYDDDDGDTVRVFDWTRAGKAIGSSKHLRHLELHLGRFDPAENVTLFCHGLALNTSIESLVIDCDRPYEFLERASFKEIQSLTTLLFRELIPFFHNNTSLESLRWIFPCTFRQKMSWILAASAMHCIEECESLKSITLKNAGFRKDVHWDSLIESICEISLQHLTFQRCSLSYNAFCSIKGLLASKESLLKSLSLACSCQDGSLIPIAIGLSQSNSIKCLKMGVSEVVEEEELTSPRFRASLKDDPRWAFLDFNSLERFEIQGLYEYSGDPEDRCNDMVDFLRKMPNLRSITIKEIVHETKFLKDILAILPPKLHELKINDSIQNKHELRYLTSKLSSSTKINPRDFSLYMSSNFPSLKN